eukprot:Hpha_TRINITY_DN13792_c0_g1::TRINITY_DN13792_c0_g1_i1::g.142498::m.142498
MNKFEVCYLRCAGRIGRDSDSAEDVRIKRGFTPVVLLLFPIVCFQYYLVQTGERAHELLALAMALHAAGYIIFLIRGWFGFDMPVTLDVTMMLQLFGILIHDAAHAAEVRQRAWPATILLIDLALTYNRPRISPYVLALTLIYLFIEKIESGTRFGLYNLLDARMPIVCDCSDPPCETGLWVSMMQWVFCILVVAVDYYMTRAFTRHLETQLRHVGGAVSVAADIGAALARYDIDFAEKAFEENKEHLPEELADSYRLLLHNLLMYRPYLPAALFASEEHDFSTPPEPLEKVFDPVMPILEQSRSGRQSKEDKTRHRLGSMSDLQLRQRRSTLLQAVTTVKVGEDMNVTSSVSSFASLVLDSTQAHKGVLLVLGGEQIVVGWNTHVPLPTHAYNGVMCGISIKQRVSQLAQADVGVCCGMVFAGSTGSAQTQIAPVVVGPLCSLSIQLARLAPLLQVACVCDEGAYEQTRGEIVARVVDVVRVDSEGTKQDRFVYELVAARNLDSGLSPDAFTSYTGGFSAFHKLQLPEAKSLFIQHLRHYPTDCQALRLLRLCYLFEENSLKDHMGRVCDSYMRHFNGWAMYEEMASVVKVSPEVQEWSALADKPASAATEPPLTDSLLEVMAPDWLEEDDKIKRAVKKGSTRVPKSDICELVDQQGRVYVRSSRALGRGAFANVFLGMAASGGLVALKFLVLPSRLYADRSPLVPPPSDSLFPFLSPRTSEGSVSLSQDWEFTSLLKEVSLMCNLRHDNIVSYLGSAVTSQHLIIILEYIPGGSLSSLVEHFDGRIPSSSARRYVSDTVNGLHYLHSQRVVHRDLKPDNLLVAADGTGKLADFGASEDIQKMAKTINKQAPLGTPQYMSPEQCRGETVPASDIWSLGIMAAELISGELPWPKGTKGGVAFIKKLCLPDPPRPDFSSVEDVGGQLALEFCSDCCKLRPDERPRARALASHAFIIA